MEEEVTEKRPGNAVTNQGHTGAVMVELVEHAEKHPCVTTRRSKGTLAFSFQLLELGKICLCGSKILSL